MKMIITSEVKDGAIPKYIWQEMVKYIQTLGNTNVLIEIKKGSKRSIQQNNYYRSVLTLIGNELGYLPDEMHNIFKYMFLSEEVEYELIDGVVVSTKSTSDLSTKEFKEYIDHIIRRAAGEGIVCPDPMDYLYHQQTKNANTR